MATTTYNFTAGSDNGDWSNEANAWDETNGTYATREIAKNTSFETSKWIKGTTNDAPASGDDIRKVEIGVEAKASNSGNCQLRLVPMFGGSSDGDNHDTAELGTSDSTTWFDITEDTNAPGTWSWSDVQDLDVRMFGDNDAGFSARTISIDQIYVRVSAGAETYNETVTEDFTLGDETTVSGGTIVLPYTQDYFDDGSVDDAWTTFSGGSEEVTYTTGTTSTYALYDGVDWSNVSNAFDGSTSTYASVTISSFQAGNTYLLHGQSHGNTVSSGTILAVEVGVRAYGSSGGNIEIFYNDNGSGWERPEDYGAYIGGSAGWSYFDITDEETWTWSKINTLDIGVAGISYSGNPITTYVSSIVLYITYKVDDGITESGGKLRIPFNNAAEQSIDSGEDYDIKIKVDDFTGTAPDENNNDLPLAIGVTNGTSSVLLPLGYYEIFDSSGSPNVDYVHFFSGMTNGGSGATITTYPFYIRLKKDGTTHKGYSSQNGTSWTQDWSETFSDVAMVVFMIGGGSPGGSTSSNIDWFLDINSDTSPANQTYNDSITDTINVEEATTPALSISSTTTDTIDMGETAAGVLTISLSKTDSMEMSETSLVGLIIGKTIAEGLSLDDLLSGTLQVNVSLSDGTTLDSTTIPALIMSALSSNDFIMSEVLTPILTVNTSITDSFSVSDSLTIALVISKVISEGYSLADVVSGGLEISKTIEDTFGITSEAFIEMIGNASLTEQMFMSDSTTNINIMTTSLTDDLSISETLLPAATFNTSLEDGVGVSDAANMTISFNQALTDSIRLEEGVLAGFTMNASIQTALSVEDTTSLQYVINLSLEDGFTITTSSWYKIPEWLDTFEYREWLEGYTGYEWIDYLPPGPDCFITDALSLADNVDAQTIMALTATSTFTVTDSSGGVITISTTAMDDFTMLDASAVQAYLVASALDSFSMNDVSEGVAQFITSISDGVDIADNLDAVLTVEVSVGDSVSVADTTTNTYIHNTTVSDGLYISETIDKDLTMTFSVFDGITITEETAQGSIYNDTVSSTIFLDDITAGNIVINVQAESRMEFSEAVSAVQTMVETITDDFKVSITTEGVLVRATFTYLSNNRTYVITIEDRTYNYITINKDYAILTKDRLYNYKTKNKPNFDTI